MAPSLRERLARLPTFGSSTGSPRLSDESRWYTEHTALLISTLKWALLGAGAGLCVGLGTRAFLWSLPRSADLARALTFGRTGQGPQERTRSQTDTEAGTGAEERPFQRADQQCGVLGVPTTLIGKAGRLVAQTTAAESNQASAKAEGHPNYRRGRR